MRSSWFLVLIAFAVSIQASHRFIRPDLKRHSRKTTGTKSRSMDSMEHSLSQPRQCVPDQSQCSPDHPDFLREDLEDSAGGTSSEKAAQSDPQCPTACQTCVPDECQLPNCKCSNFTIPGKVPKNETPIIVIVTMQDAVQNSTYKAFLELFEGLRNPNGCPATGTYFVSHVNTDYFLVQSLRSIGHEIGDNTVSATSEKQDYWKKADCHAWFQQFEDELTILKYLANVTDVRGFRAPYLQPGGDDQMIALQRIQHQQQKFVYDASRVSIQFSKSPMMLWPYTYDYKCTQDCVTPPCPKFCYKGLWEVPLLAFRDRFKNACLTLEACNVTTYNDVFRLLYDRFSDRFDSNRAPLILSMDSSWITNPFKFKGTRRFLEHALSYKEVYVVSVGQAMDWTRNPVPLSNISHFEPWKCNQPTPPVCNESRTRICTYNSDRRKVHKGVTYQFRTCAAKCPKCYPWLGDPEGNKC